MFKKENGYKSLMAYHTSLPETHKYFIVKAESALRL